MATPRRPYVTIRLGVFEAALDAGVSKASVLLLARLLTHRDKRSVPGLVQLGPAGLGESLRMSKTETERGLTELERAGLLLVDRAARLLYVVGAIDTDGPKTENAVRGMAAQLRELPTTSVVTQAASRAITATLSTTTGDKGAAAGLSLWRELTGPSAGPEPGPDSGPESGPHARAPVPRSDPEIRDPIAEIHTDARFARE